MEAEKSITELKKEAEKLREEIARLRFDLSLNKLKDTSMIKKKRRDLARILTKIRQNGKNGRRGGGRKKPPSALSQSYQEEKKVQSPQ